MGLIYNFQFVRQKNMGGGVVFNYPAALSVIAPYLVSCKARVPAVPAARYCKRSFGFSWLLSLLLLMQDTIECFPLSSQLGVFIFPCLCRDCGLAVHYAFEIIFRRRKQDFLGFGQRLLSLVLEINVGLLDMFFQSA